MAQSENVNYPCGECKKECEEDDIEGSVYCELCEIWFHRQCEGVNEGMFETLRSSEFGLFCTRCTTHKRAFKFQNLWNQISHNSQ